MGSVRRIYVEKKAPYAVRAKELKEEVKRYLGVKGLTAVRVLIRYDVENLSEETFRQNTFQDSLTRELILQNSV